MKLSFATITFVLLSVLPLADVCCQTFADQPESQRKAVKKILDLGGDWELPSKTVLVGFIGDKFTNETFSLLEPLTDLKHLSFFDIPADDSAFEHCKELVNIEWLQISKCNFTGAGLRHLSKCSKLRNVWIEETSMTDNALETLASYSSIELITVENIDVPSKITRAGILKLAKLKNAKQIYIDMAEHPADLEAEMKALLPNCEFCFTHSPANRE